MGVYTWVGAWCGVKVGGGGYFGCVVHHYIRTDTTIRALTFVTWSLTVVVLVVRLLFFVVQVWFFYVSFL